MRNFRELLDSRIPTKWAAAGAAGTLVVGGLTGTALAHNSSKPLCYASDHYKKNGGDGMDNAYLTSVLPNGKIATTLVREYYQPGNKVDVEVASGGGYISELNFRPISEAPLIDNGSTFKLTAPTGLEAYDLKVTVNTGAQFVTAQCVETPDAQPLS